MARIAFVLAEGFEDSEFRRPYDRLTAAGHQIDIVGIKAGSQVKGKHGREVVAIGKAAAEADPAAYAALVIPGGDSPDHLRGDRSVVRFVETMVRSGKLVAAICHGPQLLIEAGAVDGKTLTSWPSARTELEHAGAHWVDQQVVVDDKLITSRKPADLAAFTDAIEQRL
ncbi:MAG: intracellular protease, PfpI family [Deltaproteobacteria bacterium]|nr:intracellular protease, PfpI family [Deltaproteobacteria bacterium]